MCGVEKVALSRVVALMCCKTLSQDQGPVRLVVFPWCCVYCQARAKGFVEAHSYQDGIERCTGRPRFDTLCLHGKALVVSATVVSAVQLSKVVLPSRCRQRLGPVAVVAVRVWCWLGLP